MQLLRSMSLGLLLSSSAFALPSTFDGMPTAVVMDCDSAYRGRVVWKPVDGDALEYRLYQCVSTIDGFYSYVPGDSTAPYSDVSVPALSAVGGDGLLHGFSDGSRQIMSPLEHRLQAFTWDDADDVGIGMMVALFWRCIFSALTGVPQVFKRALAWL